MDCIEEIKKNVKSMLEKINHVYSEHERMRKWYEYFHDNIIEKLDKIESRYQKVWAELRVRIEKLESHFSEDYQLVASKLTPHIAFFDYIYPKISNKLDELSKGQENLMIKILDIELERKYLLERIDQYQKKIQRIEQFLIKNGLIHLLGKGDI